MKNKKEIVFTNTLKNNFYPPKPAKNEIPEWYKNTNSYVNNDKTIVDFNKTSGTIKRCMPVFDSITAGYILYTQVDVQVRCIDGLPTYNWPSQDAITFHPIEQLEFYPNIKELPIPKWKNPYGIKTPSGYSTLFVPPIHHSNKIFKIFEAIVDTETLTIPVEFPFILNDSDWEGLIPAGTPMAQAIPFKRESWKHKIGSDKELIEQQLIMKRIATVFYNSYKKNFWSKKEYN
jgi:hypothetical protein